MMKQLFVLVLLAVCVSGQAQNQKAKRVNPSEQKEVNKSMQGPIEFTLRNNSMKSIPLWIPGVMNPNLSPMSSSGVGLKVGQKVYFKYRGKKEVLLVVASDYNTRVVDVARLIKDRSLQLESGKKNKWKNDKSEAETESESEMLGDEEKPKGKKKKKKKK